MTAAIGWKRLAIAVAAIVAAAFVTLVALSFLIPAVSVRDAVKAEIHAVTGLDPLLGDDVSLSLELAGFPRPPQAWESRPDCLRVGPPKSIIPSCSGA